MRNSRPEFCEQIVSKLKKNGLPAAMEGVCNQELVWLRGVDLNHRPLGYEPNELPDCSTPHFDHKQCPRHRQTSGDQAFAAIHSGRHEFSGGLLQRLPLHGKLNASNSSFMASKAG